MIRQADQRWRPPWLPAVRAAVRRDAGQMDPAAPRGENSVREQKVLDQLQGRRALRPKHIVATVLPD